LFAFLKKLMLTPSQRFLSVRAATQAEQVGRKSNFHIPKAQKRATNYIVVKQY